MNDGRSTIGSLLKLPHDPAKLRFMEKIVITQLSEPVRLFLDHVNPQEGIVIEDESGRARYRIVAYRESSPAERLLASQRLESLQKNVGDTLRAAGKTEQELDRLLMEDA